MLGVAPAEVSPDTGAYCTDAGGDVQLIPQADPM
jgi:hypothetical protein